MCGDWAGSSIRLRALELGSEDQMIRRSDDGNAGLGVPPPQMQAGSGFPLQVRALITGLAGFPLQSVTRILLLTISLIAAQAGYSCSCIGAAGVDAVDMMFTGRVVRIEKSDTSVVVTFKVKHMYKGEVGTEKRVVVSTRRGGQACGIHFTRHMKYAVYAYGDMNHASTGLCTRTRIMAPFRLWPFKPKESTGW